MFDFYFPEWVFVIFNLLVLTVVLSKVLWKPVGKILDARQAKTAQALVDAEAIRVEMSEMDERRAALASELNKKIAEQMQEARVRAGREFDRIVLEAETKARGIVTSAEAQARREREGILRTARAEVVAATIEATSALLGANMSAEKNEQLVEGFLNRRFGAPGEQNERLVENFLTQRFGEAPANEPAPVGKDVSA
ncbi:MAG: ATP synthase F0 subunit B [Oscillospiraceae bacterium]|jgi:F-type H+-transporting ATPase subunit b|nr:ATP synthase F0 subunit B [Oscillospiraceae bacterium]